MKTGFFLPIIATVFIGCGHGTREQQRPQMAKLTVVEALEGGDVIRVPGRVVAADEAALSFKVGGTLARVYIKEGARVREGQVLAELDPTDYKVQLAATEAEYEGVKAEATRVMALYDEGGTTALANDKARAGLQQMEAKLQHHRDQLDDTRLKAPFDGIVQHITADQHSVVAPGTPIVVLVSEALPEVEVNLAAADFVRRGEFLSFHATFDVHPSREYPLSLIGIAPKANINQLYRMRLALSEPVELGISTTVTIRTGGEGGLCVPITAVNEDRLYVYNNGVLAEREAEVLRLLGDGRALVRCHALAVGDTVVSSGVARLADGQRVRPIEPVSKTNVGGLL